MNDWTCCTNAQNLAIAVALWYAYHFGKWVIMGFDVVVGEWMERDYG